MKKISLLLVVLLAAGSASLYGQMMVGSEFKISGDATATVGYDIDDEKFGFKNEASANIIYEIVAKQSSDNGMMDADGWVGVIELKDFRIIIDHDDEDGPEYVERTLGNMNLTGPDGMGLHNSMYPHHYHEDDPVSRTGLVVDEPTIVAKLKNGPLFLQIFDAPANVAGLIDAIEDDSDEAKADIAAKLKAYTDSCKADPKTMKYTCDADKWKAVVNAIKDNADKDADGDNAAESNDADNDVNTDLGGHGVTLGYTTDDLSVALGVSSDQPYDNDKDGGFVVSADVDVNVGPADLMLQVVQAIQVDGAGKDDTGVAGKLTTTFGDVSLNGGADLVLTGDANKPETAEDESMKFEVGLGAMVNLTGNTSFDAKYLYSSNQLVASDVEVSLKDTSGLVDRLSMGLTWGLFDLNNGKADNTSKTEDDSMDMLVKGNLSYDLDAMGGTLTPGTELVINQVNNEDATVGLTVNAVLKDAVPATQFGLQWKTENLFDITDADGMVTKPSQDGTITAWAKISYS